MSKRYGRNQKRAAAAKIKALEERARKSHFSLMKTKVLATYLSGQRDILERRVELLKSEIDHTRRELDQFCVALAPKTELHPIPGGGDFLLEPRTRAEFQGFGKMEQPTHELIEKSMVKMRALTIKMADGSMDRCLHIRVALADGQIQYAISQEAIAAMSEGQLTDVLQQEIAIRLGAALAQHLKQIPRVVTRHGIYS